MYFTGILSVLNFLVFKSILVYCIRLFLDLMKWIVRFTKRWHSKNGSEHGENPRNA
ncbi:hypothetical protein ALC56_12510 [Trachymyrmex septentrionalis]|uniref:Uncharacterized protein n=1 Tax=Trachymyrmex septentrionalis TaxID=34720 RepID=A0A195EZ44_9HYME|nr:hypothetical protein ALC56_12510 [Trachymyrmex septentrionalis]